MTDTVSEFALQRIQERRTKRVRRMARTIVPAPPGYRIHIIATGLTTEDGDPEPDLDFTAPLYGWVLDPLSQVTELHDLDPVWIADYGHLETFSDLSPHGGVFRTALIEPNQERTGD